jgi:anthranilate synthase component I
VRPVPVRAQALRQLAYSDPRRFPVLLDSAAVGALSRYSILAAFPDEELWQDASGTVHSSGDEPPAGIGFLDAFEHRWRAQPELQIPADTQAALPFRGGWIVFLGYELAGEIEPRLKLPPRAHAGDSSPAAFALRVSAGVIYDHLKSQAWMFAEAGRQASLEALEAALAAALADPPRAPQAESSGREVPVPGG